jgi:hypothetical protein
LLARFVIAAALLLAPGLARACDFAKAPSDKWTMARDHGVSWLVDPCGERFYSLGVNVLDGGYPAREKDGKIFYSWHAFAPSLAA